MRVRLLRKSPEKTKKNGIRINMFYVSLSLRRQRHWRLLSSSSESLAILVIDGIPMMIHPDGWLLAATTTTQLI